eukprot:4981198-Prorocentrum_lima.AAC.1
MTSSLVGSEMCIRDSLIHREGEGLRDGCQPSRITLKLPALVICGHYKICLLYTSDAADDM